MLFTSTDYEKLNHLMEKSPENKELITRLLEHQQFTISKISHEIRNPLALVYSTLQLIESQHPETKSFRHWSDMREDIEFMNNLLTELSAYNNGERLRLKSISSYDLLSHICLSFASSCINSEVEFTSEIEDNLPAVTGDRIKLQEVFLNLLKNAFEATAPKGCIRLHAYQKGNLINVVISDSGCGIPKEQLDEIFDMFVTYKTSGTGLGLAIAKRTIEAHQGSITVESIPQKGSVFTVSLPVT